MQTEYVQVGSLRVASSLYRFVVEEALPGAGIEAADFWAGAASLIHDLAPRNRELLARREELQQELDEFHRVQPGRTDPEEYARFLSDIGYLLDEPEDFRVETADVDDAVALIAGPQLVVPLLNARFALNAVNARWGSLYDALYGSDVIPASDPLERRASYNPARGAEVIARGRALLDTCFPLVGGSHRDSEGYLVDHDGLVVRASGSDLRLRYPSQFVGYKGRPAAPESVVLIHHGLHVEIAIDRQDAVGSSDSAGVKDLHIEAATTTIMDLEDSVAAVDADDKVTGYRNWLQLMQGTLVAEVVRDDSSFVRRMNGDRIYQTLTGGTVTLDGRSLLFIRQVGHLMTTGAVLDRDGDQVPEGILDALITGLGSLHDLRGRTELRNSPRGSMYVVKPKMHGPDEVAFACEVFARVEEVLGLAPCTIKIGIMDEERRTTLNLKACIKAASMRIVFINTGFLDRTGDEIRTSMYAGPMVPKRDMRDERWMRAYELNNVDLGLSCGLQGRGQIGKGMWAAPDNLAEMMRSKVEHPRAGASCAWVPSPTAATLHVLHYHQVDVHEIQRNLTASGPRTTRADLLAIPLGDPTSWSPAARQLELDNNLQSTLGYVVRWINSGVGCSKVPDVEGTQLMEDRATCRISSQHVGNWLLHGIVNSNAVEESLRRMATIVDRQNADDPGYIPMGPAFDGVAFLAARDLVMRGLSQPNGYTEPILHPRRIQFKDTLIRSD